MAETDKKLKEITDRLEQGVKEIFTSERYTEYLDTMSKFHNYSFNNTLLITMQKPDATLVAGYQAWQKKFNRHVKRGGWTAGNRDCRNGNPKISGSDSI